MGQGKTRRGKIHLRDLNGPMRVHVKTGSVGQTGCMVHEANIRVQIGAVPLVYTRDLVLSIDTEIYAGPISTGLPKNSLEKPLEEGAIMPVQAGTESVRIGPA